MMVRERNQNVFLIQIDASNLAEIEISECRLYTYNHRSTLYTLSEGNLLHTLKQPTLLNIHIY